MHDSKNIVKHQYCPLQHITNEIASLYQTRYGLSWPSSQQIKIVQSPTISAMKNCSILNSESLSKLQNSFQVSLSVRIFGIGPRILYSLLLTIYICHTYNHVSTPLNISKTRYQSQYSERLEWSVADSLSSSQIIPISRLHKLLHQPILEEDHTEKWWVLEDIIFQSHSMIRYSLM